MTRTKQSVKTIGQRNKVLRIHTRGPTIFTVTLPRHPPSHGNNAVAPTPAATPDHQHSQESEQESTQNHQQEARPRRRNRKKRRREKEEEHLEEEEEEHLEEEKEEHLEVEEEEVEAEYSEQTDERPRAGQGVRWAPEVEEQQQEFAAQEPKRKKKRESRKARKQFDAFLRRMSPQQQGQYLRDMFRAADAADKAAAAKESKRAKTAHRRG